MKPNYVINDKENLYFYLKVFFTLMIVGWLMSLVFFSPASEILDKKVIAIIVFYIGLILIFLFMQLGLLVGYLKGNAIKIGESQFPEIYQTVKEQSQHLGLKKVPDTYLMQSGGLLNAFATRFVGRNYVVIYSEILQEAYNKNKDAVDFVIGHELGHIKRNHISKRLWTIPSIVIPFLNNAYSRACEYTCDSIGASLNPKGVRNGLILLASGTGLYDKVELKSFTEQVNLEKGFWYWLSEKLSSHPHLNKRLSLYQHSEYEPKLFVKSVSIIEEKKVEDHTKYMPV